MKVCEWSELWLETIKGTVKESSYRYSYYLPLKNHILPHFGEKELSEVKQFDIQIFLNKKGQTLARGTLIKFKQCLHRMFETAVDNDIIAKNPCRNLRLSSKIPPQKKDVYTDEDVTYILKFAKQHRFGLDVTILLRLGLRRGELLGLKWEDIDYEKKTISIKRAVADVPDQDTGKMKVIIDTPKTMYSVRTIPVPNDILEWLKNTPQEKIIGKDIKRKKEGRIVKTEFIISNSAGTVCAPRTWSRRHYDMFMDEMIQHYAELGIIIQKLNPHELRHTCATLLVNDNKNLLAIANFLGWRDLQMLRERYAHMTTDAMREMLELD